MDGLRQKMPLSETRRPVYREVKCCGRLRAFRRRSERHEPFRCKNAYKTAYFVFEIVQKVSNTCLWELWKITATRGGFMAISLSVIREMPGITAHGMRSE